MNRNPSRYCRLETAQGHRPRGGRRPLAMQAHSQHPHHDTRPSSVLDGLLLLLAVGLLTFWGLQWSDTAPPERFASWTVLRPPVLTLAMGLHALLLVLISVRVVRRARRRGEATETIRRAGLVALTLVFAAALLAAAHQALLLTGDGLLSAKLRQYDEIAEQVDTVFLGSSRIYRHLDPVTYDRVRAGRGESGLSFNLGVPDMRMLEVLYLAEWVFDRSETVDLLIVEATAGPLELPEWNREAERTVAWHDLRAMSRIRRGIAQLERSDRKRASLLAAHLEVFERRAAAVGRGLTLTRSEPWPGLPASQRGYQSLEQNQSYPISSDEAAELAQRWNRLHDRPADWSRSLARLRREPASGRTTDPFEQELFAELEALAAEHGARVAWLVSPGPRRRPNLIAAAERNITPTVLRFDDPVAYPEFYEAAGRFDRHHLSHEMAAHMTRLVAEALPAALAEATATP
ncbi:MAG: hypothetical protein AAGK22_09830 [Acidobacteriota bacterium]